MSLGLHWTISPACFGFWVSLLVCVCVFDQLIYPRVNFISLVLSQECLRGWGRLVTSLRPIWTIARPCLDQSIYHYISSNFSHSSGWIVQLPPGRGEEVNEKITSETMSNVRRYRERWLRYLVCFLSCFCLPWTSNSTKLMTNDNITFFSYVSCCGEVP